MKTITRTLPSAWEPFLLDEEDRVPVVKEAARMLCEIIPEDGYLVSVHCTDTENADLKRYTFKYKPFKTK